MEAFDDLVRILVAELGASGGGLYFLFRQELNLVGVWNPAQDWPQHITLAVDSALTSVVNTGRDEVWADGLAVPCFCRESCEGVLAIQLASRRLPELMSVKTVARAAAVLLGQKRAQAVEISLRKRISAITQAGFAFADAVSVLPEEFLNSVVQHGFRPLGVSTGEHLPGFLLHALETLAEHARQAARAEFAALGIGNSAEAPFSPWVMAGLPKDTEQQVGRHPRAVGTLGFTARDGQGIRVKDVKTHAAFGGIPARHPEIKSFMAMPIRYGSASLGNLYVANKIDAGEFSADDEKTVELIAKSVATTLELASLRLAVDERVAVSMSLLESLPSGFLFYEAESGSVVANHELMRLLGSPILAEAGDRQLAGRILDAKGAALAEDEFPWRIALVRNVPFAVSALATFLDPGSRR